MPFPFRFGVMITVLFVVCGAARSQELAPPGSGVSIHKLVIDSALTHSVKYTVKGGSPRLQALVRRVEWAENELSVIEQMQRLKLDLVVYERHLAASRTAQLTRPYFPIGSNWQSTSTDSPGNSESSLQQALAEQLAFEGTPQAALQMIGFLEQMQTELDEQLKALPPKEKKAAQAPVDALRPRMVALSRSDAQRPVDQNRTGTAKAIVAPSAPPAAMEVEWRGTWYAAQVLQISGSSSLIHYTGWASSWDEWVPAGRIRTVRSARSVRH